jgi:excisionase family DNA binding protein
MSEEIAAILSNALLTPMEVGRVLRCNRNSLYKLIKSQEIPSMRFGDSIRVPASWLRAKLQLPEAA